MSTNFKHRFSLPHNDYIEADMSTSCGTLCAKVPKEDKENPKDDTFYTCFSNTSQDYKDEIEDIYFSKPFYYEWEGTTQRFGDVMGKEASDVQVDSLFKVQDEFGVAISITFNQENPPMEILKDSRVRGEFVEYLRSFYDRGLRICTMSHIHLMGTGILQKEFPEMKWKNTVNHIVRTAQEVIDMHALGYTTILLDRQLNRSIQELKRISKVTKERGIKTSLLVTEGCMPSCPFKTEHDAQQPSVLSVTGQNYWQYLGDISCNNWREPSRKGWGKIPRSGVSCVWDTNARFDKYEALVDIFKFSGRLRPINIIQEQSTYAWSYINDGEQFAARSFQELYDLNVGFLDEWNPFSIVTQPLSGMKEDIYASTNNNLKKECKKYFKELDHPYKTPAGEKMCAALLNCRNQCYNCHLCEDAFEYEHIDTLCQRDIKYVSTNKSKTIKVALDKWR